MDVPSSRVELLKSDELGIGEVRKVETAGLTLAVYNVDGQFYVTDDHCTHGPGSLSEGFLDGEIIECDFHQGCFNVPYRRGRRSPLHDPHQDLQDRRRERRRLH